MYPATAGRARLLRVRRIYLDHSASSPMLPGVAVAMSRCCGLGNADSLHEEGRRAAKAVESARRHVGRLLGADPKQIGFTSGGTEADNLALIGLAHAAAHRGRRHILVGATEHKAMREAAAVLAEEGLDIEEVPVDGAGRTTPTALRRRLRADTAVVAVMLANNEVGTDNDVEALAGEAHAVGAAFACDAVAALGRLPIEAERWNVDALAVSAHKIGGPPGVGALYLRAGVPIEPIFAGGTQEGGARPGTRGVPGIVGFGEAARARPTARALDRMDHFGTALAKAVERTFDGAYRLGGGTPGIVGVAVPGDDRDLVKRLDRLGVAASNGAACSCAAGTRSHVLDALGVPEGFGLLRLSLGVETTADDVREAQRRLASLR